MDKNTLQKAKDMELELEYIKRLGNYLKKTVNDWLVINPAVKSKVKSSIEQVCDRIIEDLEDRLDNL